ncbi:MAG: hypothetical protein CR982_00420 [Candidatus Cloacimonadota bacterium]|nr:MAG: hypothetical protein CR982_00420 [Candidatus Cloacimonadota bacterium]PIE78764.1 MAG: hypothetical protein CSA15_06180 [Candidatus Delongbacteria bacterium]
MKEWRDKRDSFDVKDVRKLKENFLPSIIKKAQSIEVGKGLCVVQSFEPIPLYSLMADMGYEYETEKISGEEFRVYFYRTQKPEPKDVQDMPLKPTAIVNFNTIDPTLANNVVNFWNYIWAKENPAIDMKTRLMLSLANGVGAGRMRQAVREFIKGYTLGITTEEFDEIFAMFAWNQGVGYFASEIGPSALFAAYKMVKTLEENGKDKDSIVKQLMERFGEKNPEVNTFFKKE